MGAVSGSITQSGTTATASGTTATATGTAVTSSNGKTTLTSDEIEKTDINPVKYDIALSQVVIKQFTVTSPGGSYDFTINAPTLPGAKWKHLGSVATINFISSGPAPTATFSTQPSTVDEGAEATFEVTATGLERGSSLQWTLVHVGDISQPFHYDASTTYGLSGAVTLDNSTSPKGSFKIKPLNDETTNPTGKQKQFKIEIKRNGVILATSNTITVNDTSKGPKYTLSLSPTTVDEGSSVTGTISATDARAIGETLRWALVDVPSAYSGSMSTHFTPSGTVAVANGTGSGTFVIDVKADNLDNPVSKTFKVMLYNSSGAELLASAVGPVTVTDTSKTPGLSNTIATGGTALAGSDLNNQSFYATPLYQGQDAGVGLSLMPDGSWIARETNGNKYTGKWFDPITKDIGNNYYVKITKSLGNVVGTTTSSGETDWTPLSNMVSMFAGATTYRCVDPNTPILVDETGTTKLAGELVVGDQVYTMHEYTRSWGYYTITNHEIVIQPKLKLIFIDNTDLIASESHKVYLGRDTWSNIIDLKIGDCVVSRGGGMKEIIDIQSLPAGDVVSMEIQEAHTYISNNIISHNIKSPNSSGYYAEMQAIFTIQISNQSGGGGSSSSTSTVSLGGTVGIPL
jgi:hypothetical protein